MVGLVVGIFVFVILIVILASAFSRDARLKRKLRSLKRTPIAQATASQLTKIVGKVSYLYQPLIAPLSGRHCAYYEVIVEEWRRTGRSGHWSRIIREEQGQDFVLEDETGKAHVRMQGAEVAAVKDGKFKSGTFNDASPNLQAYLDAHGKSSTNFLGFNKGMRFHEGVLEAGEMVAACGPATREADPDPTAGFAGYREQPTRLVMARAGEQPLYVSDDKSVLG